MIDPDEIVTESISAKPFSVNRSVTAAGELVNVKFSEIEVTVNVSALPTMTEIADALSTLLLKLTESVGDNKAEIEAVSTTDGVKEELSFNPQ